MILHKQQQQSLAWLWAAALMILALACPASSEDKKPERVLESVKWEPQAERLTWSVKTDGKTTEYEIRLDTAVMRVGTEERKFDQREVPGVWNLLSIASKYCADSTLWWEQGKGVPVKREVAISPLPPPSPWEQRISPLPPPSPWEQR